MNENKQNSQTNLLDKLLNAIPTFLAFAVPIFFLPIATEFFEFNKLTLVIISTMLMILIWTAKMITNRKVTITKSPLDLTILGVLVVMVLASIFSLHKTSSIFGVQGKWFPSLFGILTLAAFYYLVSENVSDKKTIIVGIQALIIGATISSIVAVLGYYGIRFGSQPYLKAPNFTLAGSITTAGILGALATSLALNGILESKNMLAKAGFSIAVLINFMCAILLSSVASWIVLALGLLVFAYYAEKEKVLSNKLLLIPTTAVVLAIIIFMIVPATRDTLIDKSYPKVLKITARESWVVVSNVITDFPVLGTGPGTFQLNYTRYKPLSVNAKEYWNIRFDRPYNQAFSIIGSLGIIGIIVAVALVTKVLKFALTNKAIVKDKGMNAFLVMSIVAILGAYLATTATITTAFILTLSVALLVAQNRIEGTNGVENVGLSLSSLNVTNNMSLVNSEKEVFQYIVAVPLLLAVGFGAFYTYKQSAGEYYMGRSYEALRENKGGLAYQFQQKAIRNNPKRASYYNSMGSTALALANSIAAQENLTQEEQTTIQNLISQAIRNTKATTEILDPLNATNWETRAIFYNSLTNVAQDANKWTVDAYNKAIQLDPSNPRLRLSLGGIYFNNEDYLSAANQFNLATTLKGDYANAHYNLAQALKNLERYQQAYSELRIVKNLINEGTKDYDVVEKELATLSEMPEVAGVQAKPTIQEIETATEEGKEETVNQEPLENVAEQQEEEVIEVEEEIITEEETEQTE